MAKFYDGLPKLMLNTLAFTILKQSSTHHRDNAKRDHSLFARMFIMAQTQLFSVTEVHRYELGPVPWDEHWVMFAVTRC